MAKAKANEPTAIVTEPVVQDLNWRGCFLFPSDVPEEALASAERMKIWLDGIGIVSMDRWHGDARIDYAGPEEAPTPLERPLGCFFGDSFYFRKRCYDIMGILKIFSVEEKASTYIETATPETLLTEFEKTFPDTAIPLRPILDYEDMGMVSGECAHARLTMDKTSVHECNQQIAWDCAIAWLQYNDLLCEMVDLYHSEQTV